MKKIIKLSLSLFMSALFFSSCQKENPGDENVTTPAGNQHSLLTAQNKQQISNGFMAYYEKNIQNQGSNAPSNNEIFIAPFFSTESTGFLRFDPVNFTLSIASFEATYGPNDFYRVNNDGSISVHINSNNAYIHYAVNLWNPAAPVYTDDKGHYAAKYTGMVEELFPGFFIVTPDPNHSAYVVTSHGRVRQNGTGPYHNISMKVLQNPGGQRIAEWNFD
jgi:hypothetical protein